MTETPESESLDIPPAVDTRPDLTGDANDLPPDPRLVAILVCPLTKGPLEYDAGRNVLISRLAGLAFPVVKGVPVMLEDAARAL